MIRESTEIQRSYGCYKKQRNPLKQKLGCTGGSRYFEGGRGPRYTIMFQDLQDSKNWSSQNNKIPRPSSIIPSYSKNIKDVPNIFLIHLDLLRFQDLTYFRISKILLSFQYPVFPFFSNDRNWRLFWTHQDALRFQMIFRTVIRCHHSHKLIQKESKLFQISFRCGRIYSGFDFLQHISAFQRLLWRLHHPTFPFLPKRLWTCIVCEPPEIYLCWPLANFFKLLDFQMFEICETNIKQWFLYVIVFLYVSLHENKGSKVETFVNISSVPKTSEMKLESLPKP